MVGGPTIVERIGVVAGGTDTAVVGAELVVSGAAMLWGGAGAW